MTEQQIIEKALKILQTRLRRPDYVIAQPDDASTYLKLSCAGLEYESFQIMFLDTRHGLISLKELFRGTIDSAAVYPREVVKAALQFNAAAVILSHNHPSGDCSPSAADRNITQRLIEALRLIDVRVLDHIVVGGDQTYSFAAHGLI